MCAITSGDATQTLVVKELASACDRGMMGWLFWVLGRRAGCGRLEAAAAVEDAADPAAAEVAAEAAAAEVEAVMAHLREGARVAAATAAQDRLRAREAEGRCRAAAATLLSDVLSARLCAAM